MKEVTFGLQWAWSKTNQSDPFYMLCFRQVDRLQAARFQADTLLEITPRIESE